MEWKNYETSSGYAVVKMKGVQNFTKIKKKR